MKRKELLRHLRRNGCFLICQGKEHELWCDPKSGHIEAVPHHQEVPDMLAREICRALNVPEA